MEQLQPRDQAHNGSVANPAPFQAKTLSGKDLGVDFTFPSKILNTAQFAAGQSAFLLHSLHLA